MIISVYNPQNRGISKNTKKSPGLGAKLAEGKYNVLLSKAIKDGREFICTKNSKEIILLGQTASKLKPVVIEFKERGEHKAFQFYESED